MIQISSLGRARKTSVRLPFTLLMGMGVALLPAGASWAQYSAQALADNPVAYYRFNETSGTTATNSATTGATNNATIDTSGGAVVLGQTGAITTDPTSTAYLFGGGSVVTPSSVVTPLASGFTLEFWFRTNITNQYVGATQWYNAAGLVDAEVGGVTSDFGTSLSGGQVLFGVGAPDTTLFSSAATNLADNAYHLVDATYSSTTGLMQLYIDGSLSTSTTGPTGLRNAPPTIRIGRVQTNINPYQGNIDEVALYNTSLTQSRISAHYTAATVTSAAAPEPASLALLLPAVPALGLVLRRRKKAAQSA